MSNANQINGSSRALAVKSAQQTLKAELERMKGSLAAVLPKHVTPDRMIKVVLSATARNESLLECSVPSICRAIMQAGELGLEIGGLLGEAYLVPYMRSYKDANGRWQKVKEAQCIVGYKGLIKLARQSGQFLSIAARLVYANDVFEVNLADEQIVHRPCLRGDRGDIICVYAQATFREGGKQIEIMTLDEVQLVRARSKASDDGPWKTDFGEMARKTVVRRLCKYLPLSTEIAEKIAEADEEALPAANVVDVHLLNEPTPSKAQSLAARVAANAAARNEAPEPNAEPAIVDHGETDGEPPADWVSGGEVES